MEWLELESGFATSNIVAEGEYPHPKYNVKFHTLAPYNWQAPCKLKALRGRFFRLYTVWGENKIENIDKGENLVHLSINSLSGGWKEFATFYFYFRPNNTWDYCTDLIKFLILAEWKPPVQKNFLIFELVNYSGKVTQVVAHPEQLFFGYNNNPKNAKNWARGEFLDLPIENEFYMIYKITKIVVQPNGEVIYHE